MSINKDVDTTLNNKNISKKDGYQNNLTVGNIDINKKYKPLNKHNKELVKKSYKQIYFIMIVGQIILSYI